MRRLPSRLTASVTAAALALGVFAAAPSTAAAASLEDKTTFLGIEGEDGQITALSDAIRWDLNQRGMDDGSTMTLAEFKLTLGCGDDDISCFAMGGETLGSTQLVFGTAVKQGSNYFVTLQALDVTSGELQNKIERTISFVELSEAQLGKTAASLVDELYGLAVPEEETPVEEVPIEEVVEEEPERVPEGALVWGGYSPRPGWKYAGVGISGALTLASLGTAVASTLMIGEKGSIRRDMIIAAENSLIDDKPSNDVDPTADDLCALAEAPPDPARPDEVTNAAVTQLCIKSRNTATVATAAWIGTAVFGVSTVLFTTLLFVHKNKNKTAAKLYRHGVGIGGGPTPDGGFMLGGSLRF